MQDLPHHYRAAASAAETGTIQLTSPGVAAIESAGPAEFGGPGDLWSPEALLVAAVADCLILSFRAVARAARLEWRAIRCEVVGVLDRVDRRLQFVAFDEHVVLDVPAGQDADRARSLLEKASHTCLITNSLTAESRLHAEVRVVPG